jgi:hypothetical protein
MPEKPDTRLPAAAAHPRYLIRLAEPPCRLEPLSYVAQDAELSRRAHGERCTVIRSRMLCRGATPALSR